MFLLGFSCALVLVLVLVVMLLAWVYLRSYSTGGLPLYDARAAIRAQERQTIHDLLAAEFAARQRGSAAAPSSDIIEGSSVEIRRQEP